MSVRIGIGGAVTCRCALELNLSATSVWGQLRDFHRYARFDFFHSHIAIDGNIPKPGAGLTLIHQFAGARATRVGRILIWREGVGYSFSDLSSRGPAHGFPHVFNYRIEPIAEKRCRLHISVRGKWTAPWIPRWIAKLWLAWVFNHMARNVHNQLMVYEIWRRHK